VYRPTAVPRLRRGLGHHGWSQHECVTGTMGPMRTSVAQFAARTDKERNLATITELVRRARDERTDLLVLPEASMYDFGAPNHDLSDAAEQLDGDFVTALHKHAVDAELTVVAGMFEVSDDPQRPHNTVIVVDSTGLRASYRKAHLYDSFGYRESDRLRAGDGTPVAVEIGGFQLGLLTCYDLRFPEFSRASIDAGADVLLVPAAWVRGPLKEEHWDTLLRARAIENTVYVAAAAQCGDRYCGRSAIIDPMGIALSALGEQTGLATAEVDAQRIREVRAINPSLANRRPEATR
jgi:deaminated glutathione amidase